MTRLRTPLSPVGTTGCLRTRWRARVVAKEEKEKEQEEGTETWITSIYEKARFGDRPINVKKTAIDSNSVNVVIISITCANAFSINLIY